MKFLISILFIIICLSGICQCPNRYIITRNGNLIICWKEDSVPTAKSIYFKGKKYKIYLIDDRHSMYDYCYTTKDAKLSAWDDTGNVVISGRKNHYCYFYNAKLKK